MFDGRRGLTAAPIRRRMEVMLLTMFESVTVAIAFAALVVSIIRAARD
jgi:ABC-type multidrug transport system permease subunit